MTVWLRSSLFVLALLALAARDSAALHRAPDFNGDGYADLPISVFAEDIGSVRNAGMVHVLYGSGSGITAAGSQVWHQNIPGIEGDPLANGYFGVSLEWGDFDQDGFSDLTIGIPNQVVGRIYTGGIQVLYGSATGLTLARSQFWSQESPGISGVAEWNEFFGWIQKTADFNGDGYTDIAVSAFGDKVSGAQNAGAINVLYGSASGLSAAGNAYFHQDTPGIADAAESGDNFGESLFVGDFDGNGCDDLVIGVPLEDFGSTNGRNGTIHVLYGTTAGLSTVGADYWNQNSSGIADTPETEERFGNSCGAGDLNGDGRDELVISVGMESIGTVTRAGAIHVLYGSSSGLTVTGAQFWHQEQRGVPDVVETYDHFGGRTKFGDFNGDGYGDLAVSAAGESVNGVSSAGACYVFYGSVAGLTSERIQMWTQDSSGVPDTAETDDHFGMPSSADLNGDGYSDLVIAAASEDVGGVADVGALTVLYGSASGLTTAGAQFWTQSALGVGTVEAGDRLGVSPILPGDYNGDGHLDIAQGAADKSLYGVERAGAVYVIRGSPGGLTRTGAQIWHQNRTGISDSAEYGDGFDLSEGEGPV
jgi:disulfide bond formation protein DsbB